MPTATFTRQITVSTPAQDCWDILTDVSRVAGWVSIIKDVTEIEHLSRYDAVLEDRFGPFRLRADLMVTVSDIKDGQSLRVHAEGEDRQVASQIKVDGSLQLDEQNGGTRVTIDGGYEVSGRVATLGAALISNKATKLVQEFVLNMEKALS